ncbi:MULTISPECIES: hypothetical protein [Eisenbergiella]|uniref:Uncharacterized protein n=1 Tax=Eisenbergiella porci TaxID=2652274 RepID=A0A6N7W2R0_9FIRM|nr:MULTISPECIES: hypothetical protein [Eisenbergiella]MDY2654531.1 hypothetical protein [Eisenbergiella porci]MSS89529.1 hypothetical protein [Eisenbergiella porci]
MQLKKQQHNHLAEINRIISMYQALSCRQLSRLFPELPCEKVMALLERLHKTGPGSTTGGVTGPFNKGLFSKSGYPVSLLGIA